MGGFAALSAALRVDDRVDNAYPFPDREKRAGGDLNASILMEVMTMDDDLKDHEPLPVHFREKARFRLQCIRNAWLALKEAKRYYRMRSAWHDKAASKGNIDWMAFEYRHCLIATIQIERAKQTLWQAIRNLFLFQEES